MIPAAPAFPLIQDQAPGERIASILRHYAGCSLSNRLDELESLVCRGVDDVKVASWKTNCATVALGILAAAGAQHPLLQRPLAIEEAFSRLVQIGLDLGAWRDPVAGRVPPLGSAMWYEIPNTGDDHVEFMLESPDTHGGGGRADNAITVGSGGDVHWSWGRPMHKYLDPDALGIPTIATASNDPGQPAVHTSNPIATT
jgi:hypothetical protein